MKDPLLDEYTVEELLYEYYEYTEWHKYQREHAEQTPDKIEEKRLKESLDWAEEEERKELEAAKKADSGEIHQPSDEDKKWMEEQMKNQFPDLPDQMSVNFEDGDEDING